MKTGKTRVSGLGWAYVGAVFGFAGSIAANVAHSYVPPDGATAGWSPPTGAVFSAIFWPVALFIAVEIFARFAWPAGKCWTVLRFGGMLPVAIVAAVVSYRHLSGLLAYYGDDPLTVAIGPLAVDGLMVMATGALIAAGSRRTTTTDAATADAVVPAAAASNGHVPAPAVTAPTVTATPARAAKPATRRVRTRPQSADKVAKVAARNPDATVAQIAAKAGVSESTARRYLPKTDPTDTSAGGAAVASPTPAVAAATPAFADAAA